jgi:hypothetical protein
VDAPGWSRTSPEGGWRLFHADALERVQTLPELFAGPRADFNPGDPHFAEVYCRLEAPAARDAGKHAGAHAADGVDGPNGAGGASSVAGDEVPAADAGRVAAAPGDAGVRPADGDDNARPTAPR